MAVIGGLSRESLSIMFINNYIRGRGYPSPTGLMLGACHARVRVRASWSS